TAFWTGRRLFAHLGGSGQTVQGHPRAHPPDRGESPSQNAPPDPHPPAPGISRDRAGGIEPAWEFKLEAYTERHLSANPEFRNLPPLARRVIGKKTVAHESEE